MSEFIEAKNALVRSFTDQQLSQAARLVGFFVALFTLLQAVQKVSLESLSKVFYPIAKAFVLNDTVLTLVETFKLSILFVSLIVIIGFIIRSIFRFAVFSGLMINLLGIIEKELPESPGSMHVRLYNEALRRLRNNNIYIFVFFPLNWWTISGGPPHKEKKKGWVATIFLAVLSASLLLFLLW